MKLKKIKTNLLLSITLSALIISCNSNNDGDKKKLLEDLRKKEAEIKKQIADLEKEIGSDQGQSGGKEKYVGITRLSERNFNTYIDVQGKVDSDENVAVSSEMPGTITKIYVKLGDMVSKGQTLAETDNKAILQGMEEIKTNLELVNTLYEKQKSLWDQKIGTEVQYLQTKTQKEGLERRLASMNEQLKMTKIVSPIDGTVDELNIKLGSATAPGFPAIRIVNLRNLKVKAEMAENYAKKVKTGNKVTVILLDTKDTLSTEIAYAAKVINPLNRTFTIEVNLAEGDFHPNMVAKLMINSYTSPKPTIVIPVGTIQTDLEGNNFVFINKGNKAVKRSIVKGAEYNGEAEILSGLIANDQLVSEGYENINEGDQLIIK
jgi:membrane fusion protein (multidrug efflux system)